jgi:glyoxylase-like metal-dependent hydrolase (beta-lactamase superfamily II)
LEEKIMLNIHSFYQSKFPHLAAEFEGGSLYLIDLPIARPGFEKFISAWLIRDQTRNRTLLIDPGPASTLSRLYGALEELGTPSIDYVLLTHVHMDHAGGMGDFMDTFPKAKIVAPSNGIKHLVDPSKLLAASLETLRDMVEVYGEMEAISEDAFADPGDVEGVRFFMTPGHAAHHQAIFYDLEEDFPILFAGEAAGTYIGDVEGKTFYMRPATPPRFFFHSAEESIEFLIKSSFSMLCYAHYGWVRDGKRFLLKALEQMRLWRNFVEKHSGTREELIDIVLDKDANLKGFFEFSTEMQRRERYFIDNSLKGFIEGAISEKRKKAIP